MKAKKSRVDELFLRRDKNDYTIYTISAIKRILYSGDYKSDSVIFYGSSMYKISLYAGDLDCMEYVHESDPNLIVKRLQQIVYDIEYNNKNNKTLIEEKRFYTIGDIKCGIDDRFDIDLGYVKNMKIMNYDPKKIIKQIDALKKYMSVQEYEIIVSKLLHEDDSIDHESSKLKISPKYTPAISQWLDVNEWFYNKKIIRWTPDDILKGHVMHNDKKFHLKDSIKNGMCKIDMIYNNVGTYMEVSNLFIFTINGKMNLDDDKTKLIEDVKNAIFEKFFAYKINVLKGFKLCYTLCKLEGYDKYMIMINKLLVGDFGKIGKIMSELATCSDILKYTDIKNINTVLFDVIDNTIYSIDYIISSLTMFDLSDITSVMTRIIEIYQSIDTTKRVTEERVELVKSTTDALKKTLMEWLNKNMIEYTLNNDLLPINKKFLN
jgi:hypothetical protein